MSSFEDDTIRKAFIRKVRISCRLPATVNVLIVLNSGPDCYFQYLFPPAQVFSVVTIQLLVTFTVVCVFTFSKTVKTAVQGNIWVYLSSYIIFAVVSMCLAVCSTFSRTHPWNLLGLVSVCV